MSDVADPNENEVPALPQKKRGWGWPSPLEVLVMIAIVVIVDLAAISSLGKTANVTSSEISTTPDKSAQNPTPTHK